MSDTENQSKKFVQDLQKLRSKLNEYDSFARDPKNKETTSKDYLNLYSRFVREVCKIFNAKNFQVYTQPKNSTAVVDGLVALIGDKADIRLKNIRLPFDEHTLIGHTFLKPKVVNVDKLNSPNSKYPELLPSHNQEIDRRLRITTNEALSAPVLNSSDKKVIGVIVVSNSQSNTAFSVIAEHGINALSLIISKSLQDGFYSKLLHNSSDSTVDKTKTATRKTNEKIEQVDENITRVAANAKTVVKPDNNDSNSTTTFEMAVDDDEEEEEEEELEEDGEEEVEEIIGESKHNFEPYYPEFANQYDSVYDYLIDKELLTQEDIDNATFEASHESKQIESILVKKYSVPLREIGISMSIFYGLPYMPFNPNFPRPDSLLANLREDYLENNKWLPIARDSSPQKKVLLVTSNPQETEAAGAIWQTFPRHKSQLMVTTDTDLQKYFSNFFSKTSEVEQMLMDLESDAEEVEIDATVAANDSSISDDELVKLVNRVISDAYKRNVSDIHIEPYPGKVKTLIRFRIDGELIEYLRLASSLRSRIINRIKIMANLDISDQRTAQDGKIKMSRYVKNLDIELRVATYPVAGGNDVYLEDAVLRILASGEPVELEKLGIRPEAKKKLIELIEKPYGIVFVCGPTGSGKTTTLHSLLKHLNRIGIKIVTAEDPVEITQAGLRQMQIDHKSGNTFAKAMRAFLRADPDVIMVGEMRDEETVSTGIEASLTGHLVMSTLHTNSAPEAITRLLDMGMDPLNFADAMLGILAQRLAKRLCSDCKVPYHADKEEIDLLISQYSSELIKNGPWKDDFEASKEKKLKEWMKLYGENGKFTLYRAKGCSSCNKGYKGRVGLYELMPGSDAIKIAVKKREQIEVLLEICLREGMDTLKMDGVNKILSGDTDLKQVMVVCIK